MKGFSANNYINFSRRENYSGEGIFFFATESRPALGPTQPPIKSVSGTISPKVKRLGRKIDHSPTSSAEAKNAWSYTPLFRMSLSLCLVKQRDLFSTLFMADILECECRTQDKCLEGDVIH
jgi:hypothetical protein